MPGDTGTSRDSCTRTARSPHPVCVAIGIVKCAVQGCLALCLETAPFDSTWKLDDSPFCLFYCNCHFINAPKALNCKCQSDVFAFPFYFTSSVISNLFVHVSLFSFRFITIFSFITLSFSFPSWLPLPDFWWLSWHRVEVGFADLMVHSLQLHCHLTERDTPQFMLCGRGNGHAHRRL